MNYDYTLIIISTKGDRKKFTTMLNPLLRDELKKKAIDEGCSVADIIEVLVKNYLHENKKGSRCEP